MAKPATRVTSPVGILSYPCLLEPKENLNGDLQYSVTVLFDKKADFSLMNAAIEAAVERGIKTKWGDERPKTVVLPFKDGDGKLDKNGDQRPEYAGKTYITVSCGIDEPPFVKDATKNDIIEKSEVYGGAEGRVVLAAYPWRFAKRDGVSFYLKGCQITGEGTPFGVNISVDEDLA